MRPSARNKLAKQIRRLRQRFDYTQDRLAEIAGIDYKYVQRIEGKSPPAVRIDTLEKLAKAFRMTLSELLKF